MDLGTDKMVTYEFGDEGYSEYAMFDLNQVMDLDILPSMKMVNMPM